MIQIKEDRRGQLKELLFPGTQFTSKDQYLKQFKEFLTHYIAIGQLGEYKNTQSSQNILMSCLLLIWNGSVNQAIIMFKKYELLCKLTEQIQIIENFSDLEDIIKILQEFIEWEQLIINLSKEVDIKNNGTSNLNSINNQFIQFYEKFQPHHQFNLLFQYQQLTYKDDFRAYLNTQKPEIANTNYFDQYFSIIEKKPFLFLQFFQQLKTQDQNQMLNEKVYKYLSQSRQEKYKNIVSFIEIMAILQKFDIINKIFDLIIQNQLTKDFDKVMAFFQQLYPLKQREFQYKVDIPKSDSLRQIFNYPITTPLQENRLIQIKSNLQYFSQNPRTIQQLIRNDFILSSNQNISSFNTYQFIKNIKNKDERYLIVQMAQRQMYIISTTIMIFYKYLKGKESNNELKCLKIIKNLGSKLEGYLIDILIECREFGKEQECLNKFQELFLNYQLNDYSHFINSITQKLQNRLSILNSEVQIPNQKRQRIIMLNSPIYDFMMKNPKLFTNQQVEILKHFTDVQIINNINQTSACTAIYQNQEYYLIKRKINADSLIILLTAQSQQYNHLHKLQHLSFDNEQNMLLLFNNLDVIDNEKRSLNIAKGSEQVFQVNKYSDVSLDDIRISNQEIVITNYWYRSHQEFDPIKVVKSYLKSLPFKTKRMMKILNDEQYKFQNIAQLVKYCEIYNVDK